MSARKDGESSFHYCGIPVKLVQACLWAENTLQTHLNRRGCAVKQVKACLSARKDVESSFHHCGGPVKPCFCSKNTLQCRLYRRGRAVKQVKACLSARKDRESSFHHCGGPEKLVQACLCAENNLNAVLNTEEVLSSTCSPG